MTTITESVRERLPRIDSEARPPHTFTHAPAQTMPVPGAPRDWVDVLISKVKFRQYFRDEDPSQEVQDRYVGRVHKMRSSLNEANGWFFIPGAEGEGFVNDRLTDRYYVEGTELNPAPVVGHYYQMLTDLGVLLQYTEGGRWKIIEGVNGSPWPYSNDSLIVPPDAYFEVVYGDSPDSEDEEEEEPSDVRQLSGIAVERFQGKAEMVDGVVYQVLEFEDGVLYAGYSPSETDVVYNRTYFGMKTMGVDMPLPWGIYTLRYGGSTTSPDITNPALPEDMIWAKAAAASVGTSFYSGLSAETYRATTVALTEGFAEFNTALNELADRMDWCREYEEAVQRLGMQGREKEHPAQVRLAATVNVTIELTDDSPGYRIDNAFASEYDVSEVTSVTATATLSTIVEFVMDWDSTYDNGWDDDVDASDFIGSSEVEDALDGRITGASWTLEDWNVESVTESDDQDF